MLRRNLIGGLLAEKRVAGRCAKCGAEFVTTSRTQKYCEAHKYKQPALDSSVVTREDPEWYVRQRRRSRESARVPAPGADDVPQKER